MNVLLVYGNVSSIKDVEDYINGYNFSLNSINMDIEGKDDLFDYYVELHGDENIYEFEPDTFTDVLEDNDCNIIKSAYNSINDYDVYIAFIMDEYNDYSNYDEDYEDNYYDEEWY